MADTFMDHTFFTEVAKRLRELEAERDRRYGDTPKATRQAPLHEYLFRHPSIVGSPYWTKSDSLASSDCFDWDSKYFPDQYVATVRTYSSAHIVGLAERPYSFNGHKTILQSENTKTLVARLLLLRLEHLLNTR